MNKFGNRLYFHIILDILLSYSCLTTWHWC